jgi:hypothetical protein
MLVISGSMGSGKTTLLGEASDLLTARGAPHAAIDLDVLGLCHLPSGVQDDLTGLNLSAVWRNYAVAGVRHLLISEAIDSEEKLARLRRAVPGAQISVCRLRAGLSTMKERVRAREPGMLQARYVDRVAELEAALDAAGIEDFSVETDGRPATEAAIEMLTRAGWW